MPETLKKCGFSKDEIQLIANTKVFDITDAVTFIKNRRFELIKPSPELTVLFTNHRDVSIKSIH